MKKWLGFFLVAALLAGMSSCKMFKKKCDCPDHRRAKRIAGAIHLNAVSPLSTAAYS
ncbi:MAG: hypothetical protein R2850_06620 [Bacteroidia bacterium]